MKIKSIQLLYSLYTKLELKRRIPNFYLFKHFTHGAISSFWFHIVTESKWSGYLLDEIRNIQFAMKILNSTQMKFKIISISTRA